MKKTLLLLAAISLLTVSCKEKSAVEKIDLSNVAENQNNLEKHSYPKIKFNKLVHDFGDIKNNEKVETEFELTNVGDTDLIIINASSSCGCTVPEYQKTPIKPGEVSKLKVAFVTSAEGQQNKTVTLTTNTENGEEILSIKANVAPKE